ncbi:MAG: hypothetical protein KKE61_20615, partial [Proteobacteria bacterium]|nr:hypothetical protein [Pseudomonadota bacterium]
LNDLFMVDADSKIKMNKPFYKKSFGRVTIIGFALILFSQVLFLTTKDQNQQNDIEQLRKRLLRLQ